jgi:RHS repeat-associated protein
MVGVVGLRQRGCRGQSFIRGSGVDMAQAGRVKTGRWGQSSRLLLVLLATLTAFAPWGVAQADGPEGGSPPTHDGEEPPPPPDIPFGSIVETEAVGYLKGGGSVSPSGSAQYAIPLMVPPGRGGMSPSLALTYDSGAGNGPFGVGFSLGAGSSITRCPRTLAEDAEVDGIDWDAWDAFCLDGQRLGLIGVDLAKSALVFRTERESFSRIEAVVPNGDFWAPPTLFRVWSRDGRVLDYEPVDALRTTVDPADGANLTHTPAAARWILRQVADASGNTMTYEYDILQDPVDDYAVEQRLSRIVYTDSPWDAKLPNRYVELVYEERPGFDQSFGYHGGFRSRAKGRVSAIEMYAPLVSGGLPALAFRYRLDYTLSDTSYRTLLDKVRLCDAADVCTWAKEIEWNTFEDEASLAGIPVTSTVIEGDVQEGLSPTTWCWEAPPDIGTVVLDADGDGRSDLLYWDDWECIPGNGAPGIWGKLVWHLKLRLSDTGPLAHELEVGTTEKAICPVNAEGSCNYPYVGVVLGASRPIDVNGDGAYELYAHRSEGGLKQFAFWRWNPATLSFDKDPWVTRKHVEGTDFDGDGLVDLFESDGATWTVRLNQGPPAFDFGLALATGVPDTLGSQPNECKDPVRAGDFDANGRGDVLLPGAGCAPTVVGFDDSGILTTSVTDLFVPNLSGVGGLVVADLNGDGLGDLLRAPPAPPVVQGAPASPVPWAVRWNVGSGFLDARAMGLAPDSLEVHTLDINGDGREDLLAAEPVPGNQALHSLRLYVSMANGAGPSQLFQLNLLSTPVPSFYGEPYYASDKTTSLTTGDFDGDGQSDVVELVGNSTAGPKHQHDRALILRQLDFPTDIDRLVGVRDEGASHSRERFVYSRAFSDAPEVQDPATCVYPARCIEHGMTVVREHWVSPGEALLPAYDRTFYSYERPRMDLRGRGFLGFGEVRTWDPDGFRESRTTFDNVTRVLLSGREVYPFAGLPAAVHEAVPLLEQPVDVPSGPLPLLPVNARFIDSTTNYRIDEPTFASHLVQVSRWTSVESEGDVHVGATGLVSAGVATPLRTRAGTLDYDVWGNTISSGTTTTGGVSRTTTASYVNKTDPGLWHLGLPDRVESLSWNAGSVPPAPRVVDYDYYPLGLLFSVTVEPDHPFTNLWSQTVLGRDGYGFVHTVTTSVATGELPRTTRYFADADGVFVEHVLNALGHWVSTTWWPQFGVPYAATDESGVASSAQYDGLGRTHSVTPGDGMVVTTSLAAHEPAPGVPEGLVVTTTAADGSQRVTTVDEHGRTTEESTLGLGGVWSTSAVRYNLFGAPTVVTRPGDGVPSTDEVTTTYDGLGRVVRVVEPNGATTLVEPTMFRTKSWDADGNLRVAVKDVDGRVVSTSSYEDLAQQHVIDTIYRYGAFDQIDRITDALGHVTTLGYDTLGRRTYLDDPDMGPTTFTYNGFGEVVTEVNALLVPTTTTYDDLGRIETVTDADGTRTFLWDAAVHGTGRLAQTTSADDVVVTYAYEPRGFLESQTWTHDASQPTQESFTVDLVHDTLGRLDEVRYPDVPGRQRFVLKNVYDGATGELTRRDDATDPLAPSMLWQVDAREVDGSLAHATYGTGGLDVALTRQYDPATGRLEHIDMRAVGAGGAASPLHAMAYHYTAGGAVDERIDEVAQRRETFGYDASDRLTSWTVESLTGAFPMRQTVYDFDDLGNLEQVLENGLVVDTMTYGWGGKPHVLASKNGQAYGYDAKGRQVDGPERTIGFSASDLPKTVQTKGSLGTTTTYTYDAGGTRVRKRTPSEETIYVGGLYEQRKALANGPQSEHVFHVPGESGVALQVTYEEATGAERRDVVAEDALGTVSGVIDAAGVVSEKRYYDPYGKKVLADGSAAPTNGPVSDLRRGFTGHEEDAESGLTNMRGRMYDPGQRRFVTPDPFVSDPFFGQGLNRYAYVTNNPLRWVDPSGFEQAATALPMKPRPNLDRLLQNITAGQAQTAGASSASESPATDASTNPTAPQKADEGGTQEPPGGTEAPPIGPPPPPVAPPPPAHGMAQEFYSRYLYSNATKQGQGG